MNDPISRHFECSSLFSDRTAFIGFSDLLLQRIRFSPMLFGNRQEAQLLLGEFAPRWRSVLHIVIQSMRH